MRPPGPRDSANRCAWMTARKRERGDRGVSTARVQEFRQAAPGAVSRVGREPLLSWPFIPLDDTPVDDPLLRALGRGPLGLEPVSGSHGARSATAHCTAA